MAAKNASIWNDNPHMVDALKAHLAAHLSASMIAQRLNDRFSTDFSRSAIIGKIHRLGLNVSESSSPQAKREHKARRIIAAHAVCAINQAIAGKPLPHIDPVKAPKPEPIDEAAFAVTFAELAERHCRWPVQDSPFLFCGNAKQFDSSYCTHHHAMAYRREYPPLSEAERGRRSQTAMGYLKRRGYRSESQDEIPGVA